MNLRDLGGYSAGGGRQTQYGRIFRSDAPVELTPGEIEDIRGLGIRTVIDLRTDGEVARRPSSLTQPPFTYHHCTLHEDALLFPSDEQKIGAFYFSLAQRESPIAQVLRIIAHSPSAVLFHCSAGKDRTGVITAILLMLCGVDESDILADYQVSYTYIRPMIRLLLADFPDLPAFTGHSNLEYMEEFLRLFRESYHTAEEYLRRIGISDEETGWIREKMLRPGHPITWEED